MTNNIKTDAEKREALRARIEQSEQRIAQRSFGEQARDAADDALGYVKANPLKTVAAVAVGALILGALSRPGRRVGTRAGHRVGTFANVATEAALAYGTSLFDGAGSATNRGRHRLAEFGDNVTDRAKSWQRDAGGVGSHWSDVIGDALRRGRDRAGTSFDDLRRR